MDSIFQTIGIIGYPRYLGALSTHRDLYFWLKNRGHKIIVEKKIAQALSLKQAIIGNVNDIGRKADLAIIIGGDGNMLSAAKILSYYNIKIIGINRGNLGFLTDLDYNSALHQLSNVLDGNFFSEKRFLLEIYIFNGKKYSLLGTAINEIVLRSVKNTHMIEFEVYIDNIFAFVQYSDGLIVSTPTGSTAYSLSVGGPILTPSVDAITLIPMFPHTLSSRPLIINGNSIIKLKFSSKVSNFEMSCDGKIVTKIRKKKEIFIFKSNRFLDLVHQKNYNYFSLLNKKLGWSRKFF